MIKTKQKTSSRRLIRNTPTNVSKHEIAWHLRTITEDPFEKEKNYASPQAQVPNIYECKRAWKLNAIPRFHGPSYRYES